MIGGDAAGMTAASQARRLRNPDELQICAFERGAHTSWSACGIPYWIGGQVEDRDDLVVRTPEQFWTDSTIEVQTGHQVEEIDTAGGRIRVRDLAAGQARWESFDQLMIGTGSVPVRPSIPGIDAKGVFGVQTLGEGSALHAAMTDPATRRVVVVGAGYIGMELAEAAKRRGLEVTVVDRSEAPMGTFDPDAGESIAQAIRGLGVQLVLGTGTAAIETSAGRASAVHLSDGTELPADLVVLGLGVRPQTELAEAAGIPIGVSGGIAVDRGMRTGAERVWAAGDCVESRHRLSGRPIVVALGTHANKQGRVAGINIGGGYASFPGVIGTAITKICELEAARTGLSSREADEAGFGYVSTWTASTTKAGYFPGHQSIRIKLLAERRLGRLLGAQIVGGDGAAKRIDVFATAIWNEMTVGELLSMDLAYAPPFAPVWDPVLIAARKSFEAVEAAR